ncbi:MAG: PQQ-dependent sugar dehydrogenase [Myxococcota bacterium]
MRKLIAALVAAGSLSAGAARAQNPLLELVTSADSPSYLADPGDGRLFITELGGRIRIYANGALQDPNDAFLDLSGAVDFGPAGEGGLHSLAFDPGFATNHFVYVAYTRTGAGGSPLETVIERYTANDPNHADVSSHHLVLTQQSPPGADFGNHKGGQLQFGPDGFLYFAFGDGGSGDDPGCRSQNHGLRFGKMLRIDPGGDDFPGDPNENYAIPAGNPFSSDPNYAPEIWALGLRNPYRFSFDRETGDLWIGDVGQSTREEIDMDPAPNRGRGLNFGWKVKEGTTCHFSDPKAAGCPVYVAGCSGPGYTDPVDDYGRSVGSTVIGGFVYRGGTAAWRGRYIFADHGSNRIFALIRSGNDWQRVVISDNDVSGPASLGEDHDGELYVLSLDDSRVSRLRFDLIGQTKPQVKCIEALNAGFIKLADQRSSQIRSCVDLFARGKLTGAVQMCIDADPKSKLAKIGLKTQQNDAALCSVPPDFGYAGAGAAAGNAAALAADLDLAHDVLGDSLDAAIAPKASQRDTAGCQKSVLAALDGCQRTRRAEFLRCKKAGLKAESLLQSSDLAACLDTDPKARIAKACDPATGKLALKAIAKSCTAKSVDLTAAFPGCTGLAGPADAPGLASCLAAAGSCRTCQLFNAADALGISDCGACE